MNKIELIIDCREQKIIEQMPEYETRQLDIGDFQIMVDDNPKFILERKTLKDLEASIKDSRYKEQKMRALTYCSANDAVYLLILEGIQTFSFGDSNQNQKMITSSIINSTIRDKIRIIYTKNTLETVKFLECLTKRIRDKKDIYLDLQNPKQNDYNELVIKQRKKDNIDIKTCLMMQMCAIPGISTKKAEAILSVHSSINNINDFCIEMSRCTSKEFFKNVHGIGNVLQKSIYSFCGIDSNS